MAKPNRAQLKFLRELYSHGPANVHELRPMSTDEVINSTVARGWAHVDLAAPGGPRLGITPDGEALLATLPDAPPPSTPKPAAKTTGTAVIGFRAGDLLPYLRVRSQDDASLSGTAKRDLGTYYQLLDDALTRLRRILTRNEAAALMQALRNLRPGEGPAWRLLWADVATAEALGEQWNVAWEELLRKVRSLTPTETVALADAALRYQILPPGGVDETLRAVGLLE